MPFLGVLPRPYHLPSFHPLGRPAGQPVAASSMATASFLLFSNIPRQSQAAARSCSKAAARSSSKLRSPGSTPRAASLAVDPFVHVAFIDQDNSSAPFPTTVVEGKTFAPYHVFKGMAASVMLYLLLSLLPTPFALCCSSMEMLRLDCGYIF
jgi:hypothetical protein